MAIVKCFQDGPGPDLRGSDIWTIPEAAALTVRPYRTGIQDALDRRVADEFVAVSNQRNETQCFWALKIMPLSLS